MHYSPQSRQHRDGDHTEPDAGFQLPGLRDGQPEHGQAAALPGADPPHGQSVPGRIARVLLLSATSGGRNPPIQTHTQAPKLRCIFEYKH